MTVVASKHSQGSISVVPLKGAIGAEIIGADLSSELDDRTFAEIRDAFHEHSILLFRGRPITEEQHIAFSRRFGKLVVHPLKWQLHPKHDEIAVVSNIIENGRPIGAFDAGRFWHSDLSYSPVPSMGSLLYAVEIPYDDSGKPLGDTLFANVTAAYDALPEDIKKRVTGLKARYSLKHRNTISKNVGAGDARVDEGTDEPTEAIHPVIRTHPATGRKSIYANEGHTAEIIGMPKDEGDALLKLLYAHSVKPEFRYRHTWQVHDLIMWDNTAAEHLAIHDYKLPQRRRMQRTTIEGEIPF